ncbi:MAG: four helix bundle protein [Opitutae bacterium]
MNDEKFIKKKDLKERSFEFAKRVIFLCQKLEQRSGVARTISNQLLRSGTSIGANIEEAHGSQSKADFTAKMYISCKEARETHYWLRLLIETKMISEKQLADLLDESNQLISILTSIVKKASNSSD